MPKQSSANLNADLFRLAAKSFYLKEKQVRFFYFLKKIGFFPVAVALSRSKLEIALLRLRQRNGKIFML